ncbi:hypothetical protein TRIUR3_14373 [Triticum urartu]|uniref:mTERF domain-containing protein 1, mitochondrial n=1 Tax=Triticum urartu TaxID=4572 RepID=M7YRC0_TRIUA|nr:hypothetical protein TRIUR3_14373 [Triticum urartu]
MECGTDKELKEYLVDTCGLTRPQALKASLKLSHLKSPANPDAVLGFLAGLGLSGADVAAVVAKDPQFLCASVDKTLAPVVTRLTGLGLSSPEIARLVSLAHSGFRCRSVVSKLHYYLPLLGSFHNFLRLLKHSSRLLFSNPDKVVRPNVAFLRECGLVDRTLAPKAVGLAGIGLSRPEIARLVSLGPECFRSRHIVSKLQYYHPLFGSFHNFLRAYERSSYLLSRDLDKMIKPNVAFLHECGLAACDIVELVMYRRGILTTNPGRLRAMVACAEGIGVPRGSGMFRQALYAVAFQSEEKIAAKVDYLKTTLRWSAAEVGIAVSKAPMLLRRSKDTLRSKSEFLVSEVGLEPTLIAHRPIVLTYSLEGRLRPRHYLLKFVKANGLLDRDHSYICAVGLTENVFVKKFVRPHIEAAPHLAEDYAAACRGEVPTRFMFD